MLYTDTAIVAVGSDKAAPRYSLREARSVTQVEWDRWVEGSPGGGHILQSYEWGEFKRTQGWKPVRLVLERDGEIAGIGQFLVYDTAPIPGKLMYCTKGPWLPWEDREAVQTFFGGVRTVAEREGAHTVKIEPEVLETQADVRNHLAGMGFRKARVDLQFKTTLLVDLSPPEDELLRRMKEKTRYNIRLAGRKGVVVREDNSPEAREAMYHLLRITAERDGFELRPCEYYRSAWQAMYDNDRARLFFAEHGGERLAGILIYTFGKRYWYMHGASSNEKRNLMPTYLLQWEVMRWAKSQGITCYDMVAVLNPGELREDHPKYGLYRFKIGFGGEVNEFLGCLDLHVRSARAAAWHRLEPLYYRIYRKLHGGNYFY
ncbi:MAG: peptidoglycan bridge formation glycyltransferase FemA/FemB family protein [Chloroflexota bacterium]|nr:peptidoglycan bridge formation glycyltransferase FemA/FemB family protein [Chloroflexota bacterium]